MFKKVEVTSTTDATNNTAKAHDQNKDDDLSASNESRHFHCPEPGCSKQFSRSQHLDNHMLKGVHEHRPEKETLQDYALQSFKCGVEKFSSSANMAPSSVTFAIAADGLIGSEEDALQMGWAIPQPTPRKRYSTKVRQFLHHWFDEGITTDKKRDPRFIQKAMIEAKENGKLKLNDDEVLSWKQIGQFMSQLAMKRRLATSEEQTIGMPHKPVDEEEKGDSIDDTNGETWEKEPSLQSAADEIGDVIEANRESIFNP